VPAFSVADRNLYLAAEPVTSRFFQSARRPEGREASSFWPLFFAGQLNRIAVFFSVAIPNMAA
jgi:hypothetical protein